MNLTRNELLERAKDRAKGVIDYVAALSPADYRRLRDKEEGHAIAILAHALLSDAVAWLDVEV